MGSWWSDLQGLERLRSGLDIGAAVLGVVAAILIISSRWPVARRISQLQSAEKAALVERVRVAETQAEAARKNLRSLVAEATVVVAGDWTQPLVPGGHTPLALPQDDPYVVLKGADLARSANFHPTYVKRFNDSDGTARVVFRAAVRDGAWPLGESSDILRGLRPVSLALPMFTAGDTKTGEAEVRRLELSLFANGQSIYSFARDLNSRAVFPSSGWRIAETNLPPIE
jgi:hypothetical protein